MRRPNFFIVGAPKAGTTALLEYLRGHPQVFVPEGWIEPGFFAPDLCTEGFVTDEADYDRLFEGADGRHLAVGEKTVWYLSSEAAPSRIRARHPDARIVVMLRNPVEVIAALHAQEVLDANEPVSDLRRALALEAERRQGAALRGAYHPEALQYRRVVRYAEQLRRYHAVFGEDRVLVIFYEDFKARTAGVYREVLAFLGVDPDYTPEFRRVRPARAPRSHLVQRLVANPPPLLVKLAERLPGTELARRARRVVQRANPVRRAREPIPADLRAQLVREVSDDVADLEALLGRALPAWRQ